MTCKMRPVYCVACDAKCLKSLVVCAVRYEPVSNLQFPASREFAGNFADSGFRVPIPTLYLTSKISGFLAKFPTQRSREFLNT
jgi:hypothetical protein